MKNAVIGSLRVNLGIDSGQLNKGLQDATKQLDRVGKQMQSLGKSMAASLTAPLGRIGASILKTAATFEKEMANLSAVLRPTEVEFRLLAKRAEELNRTTKFTAAQAASGMEMLARNGLKTGQILGGAADATLHLAAAAGSELAPAADAITDIFVNFQGASENLKGVIDQVSGTLVSSKMDWEDYRLALGQAAGAAGPLGMSFEDMNAALAATAASFSSGVEAGTSLKGFLLKLAPSSKQSKENIKALGLEFWDAAGNMKPLAEIAQELQVKLGGLTKQSQTEVLGQLFGQRVIRTALRLMEEGAEGVERFKAAIATGDAEEMAAKRLDHLEGAVLMLKSAWEGLTIEIGKSGLMRWTRALVDALREMLLSLSQVSPQLLRFVTVFAGLTLVAGPLVIALGLVASALAAISLSITGVIAAFAAVSAAVALWGRDLEQIGRTFQVIHDDAKTWLVDKFGWVIDGATALIEKLLAAFRWLADKLGLTALAAALKSEFSATAQRLGHDLEMIKEIGSDAADYVDRAWRRAGASMQSVAEEARSTWSRMAEQMVLSFEPKFAIRLPILGDDTFDSAANSDAERLIKAMDRDAKSAREELMREGQQVFEATRKPAEALRIEFDRLNNLLREGAISFDTYTRAVADAQNEFSGLNQTAESVSESFGRSLEGMILDGKNWRDSLAGFMQDIARELIRTAALTPLMNALKGGITSGFSGGGFFSGLPGFANGGSFKVGGAGGIDSQLVAFRASPTETVSVSKPSQEGRGGVSVSVPITIDATGADAAELARVRGELTKLQTNLPGIVTQSIRKANNSNVKLG